MHDSCFKPFKPVSHDIISQWVKTVLQKSGIDVHFLKPHSTRAAATSKAFLKPIPLDHTSAIAGWSSSVTFAKLYKKPVINTDSSSTVLLQDLKTPKWFAINMFFGVCYFCSCAQCALKSQMSPQCSDGIESKN